VWLTYATRRPATESGGIDDQLTVVIPKHYWPRAKGQYRRGKAWIEASREAQGHR
jgi:hypothetical protein